MPKVIPECFRCKELDKEEHEAIKALGKGEANPFQQKLALSVIVNKFGRSHDLLYIPGGFDESAFLNGRAYVGQQILKYLKIPVGQLNIEEDKDETN